MIEIDDEQRDVVLLPLVHGLAGPISDFSDQRVSELGSLERWMGFHEMHEAVETVQFLAGIGCFGNSVGVENVAVPGLERKFEGLVFGFVNQSKNNSIFQNFAGFSSGVAPLKDRGVSGSGIAEEIFFQIEIEVRGGDEVFDPGGLGLRIAAPAAPRLALRVGGYATADPSRFLGASGR